MIDMEQAELLMWMADLDALDSRKRMIAGLEVCRILGVSEAMRAMAGDGDLRPPPAWPLVDVVPRGGGRDAGGGYVRVVVRTLLGGIVESEQRMALQARGTSYQDAIADCVERGKRDLEARVGSFVVGVRA